MEDKSNHIRLLKLFVEGKISSEEKAELRAWMLEENDVDPELKMFLKTYWQAASRNMPPDIQKRMYEKIRANMPEAGREERKVTLFFPGWLRYVAVVLLCVGVGIGVHKYTYSSLTSEINQKEYILYADRGQRSSVILPDGSQVWLNSHTEITYSSTYGFSDRMVALKGEAYFEVAKDTKNPFIVKTDKMEVEALGTAFNLKAYEEDEEIIATLFEGKVKVTAGYKQAILYPNQYAVFNRSHLRLTAGNSENASYAAMWRYNELSFNKETLENIAVMLNRMYNVQVAFTSEEVKKHRFSGVIRNNSLDNVFEIISLTAPIVYESRGDTIWIGKK